MSEAVAVPTVAQRLGIQVRSRKRVRKPGPPREVRHLMAAICYFTLDVIVVARMDEGSDVIAIALFAVLGGLHVRSWARRVPMYGLDQVMTLGGIIAQVIMLMFGPI